METRILSAESLYSYGLNIVKSTSQCKNKDIFFAFLQQNIYVVEFWEQFSAVQNLIQFIYYNILCNVTNIVKHVTWKKLQLMVTLFTRMQCFFFTEDYNIWTSDYCTNNRSSFYNVSPYSCWFPYLRIILRGSGLVGLIDYSAFLLYGACFLRRIERTVCGIQLLCSWEVSNSYYVPRTNRPAVPHRLFSRYDTRSNQNSRNETSTTISKAHQTVAMQYYTQIGAPIRRKWYTRWHIRKTDSIALLSFQRSHCYDRTKKISYV